MKVQKITEKTKLSQENVQAEGRYECLHDCVDYKYTASTATKKCARRAVVSAKTTPTW
ncbi:hypothetical protein [Ruminococcus albus]|uniref:Uncharacterized protein n=1 Tax=Ruminococcus albus TaxID=1264 RepID=A0A1I1P6J7_RUMAL|nr:hypothetical protein [Ruminococcus albus]SFD05222.1 hypothetical protein SAMN02910406_02977 [Ruminococcus albus]